MNFFSAGKNTLTFGYFPWRLAIIYIPDYTRQWGKNQFFLGYSARNSAARHVTQNLDNDRVT